MTPQLLVLKRSAPDTVFLFASSGEDVGNALKCVGELGWKPRITGNWTVGAFVEAAETVARAGAMKGVTGASCSGFTYCKAGAQLPSYLRLVANANAKNLAPIQCAPMPIVALFYDAAYLMKSAIEGNGGKADGKSIATRIEEHGESFKGVSGGIGSGSDSHFRYCSNSLSTVYPGERGDAGIQERAEGC
jgi:ABC-type branched-subunit amino acid transport system substrate-binding protein